MQGALEGRCLIWNDGQGEDNNDDDDNDDDAKETDTTTKGWLRPLSVGNILRTLCAFVFYIFFARFHVEVARGRSFDRSKVIIRCFVSITSSLDHRHHHRLHHHQCSSFFSSHA